MHPNDGSYYLAYKNTTKDQSHALTSPERVLCPLGRIGRCSGLIAAHVGLWTGNTGTLNLRIALAVVIEAVEPHCAIILGKKGQFIYKTA
jgi:hypothetical protein